MSLNNNYIKVFYRVLPCETLTWEYVKIKDKKTIYARKLQEMTVKRTECKHPSQGGFWEFPSDGVFVNASQETVFNTVTEDMLERYSNNFFTYTIWFSVPFFLIIYKLELEECVCWKGLSNKSLNYCFISVHDYLGLITFTTLSYFFYLYV